MLVALFHFITSLILRFARARSSAGVFCVFLINPCSTTSISSSKHRMSRAILWLGSDERTSQRPSFRLPTSGLPIGQPNCTRMRSSPIACRSPLSRRRSQSSTGSLPLLCDKTGPEPPGSCSSRITIQYVPKVIRCPPKWLNSLQTPRTSGVIERHRLESHLSCLSTFQ
jgi:hypothetical protein